MKKNVIAFLLVAVMAIGSGGSVPVLASETTEHKAVAVEEETVEDNEEISAEKADGEVSKTAEKTFEENEVDNAEEEPEQPPTESVEEKETSEDVGIIEDTEEADSADIADTSTEVATVEEPAEDVEEGETETVDKEAALEAGDVVDSGTCGNNAEWTLTGEGTNLTLTISGSGDMKNYEYDPGTYICNTPWFSKRAKVKTVILENGITNVGNNAFNSCTNLTNVTIPDSVVVIGNSAFSNCSNLTNITIPSGVSRIGGNSFYNCKALSNLIIPDQVTSIGGGAFSNCENLTSITIPYGVTEIGRSTFSVCSKLSSVNIPDSVRMIGKNAFYYCESLKSITIPDSVSLIEQGAFERCSNLRSITIPPRVSKINSYTFCGCHKLSKVTIPDGVQSIGEQAFVGRNLTEIIIPNSVTMILDNAFGDYNEKTDIWFRGTKEEWDSAVGNRDVTYKSVIYNYFSVDADFNLSGTSFNYTGKAIKPAVTVTYNGQELVEGTDYELVYKNNTNAGKASVDINGIGEYSGTATKTFTIKKIANAITAKNFTRTYSTKVQSFDLGVKIKKGTPTYKSNSKSVTVSKAGKVTVKAKFIGKATITITAPASTNYTATTKKITVTVNPTKTALSSVSSPSAGKMTVKWKKNAVGNGYLFQYSTSSKFEKPKTVRIAKNTILTKTIGSLAKGKKYYVRIRTYKTVGSTKFYSGWSAAKSVTIKK